MPAAWGLEVSVGALSIPGRPRAGLIAGRFASACRSPVVWAFMASRALALVAGAIGALAEAPRPTWPVFDPSLISDHLGRVGNLLGASAVRWDAIHYLQIASGGYRIARNTVFFPLYPLCVHVLGWWLGSEPFAGMVLSLACFAVALRTLWALARLELGAGAARAGLLLLAFAPLSFFFGAVYTEAMFLALSTGSLYAARTGRWRLAAVLAALAALTRLTGVALIVPLALLRYREGGRSLRQFLFLAAPLAALLAYLGYTAVEGYGLLAPFSQEAMYGRQSTGPVLTVIAAVKAAAGGLRMLVGGERLYQPSVVGPLSSGAESVALLLVLGLALWALRETFRRLPFAYGAYSAAALLLCLGSPVPSQPLMSFDRYTLTIFPLWMAAGAWLAQQRWSRVVVVLVLSAALLAFYSFQFATWAFVA